MKRGHIIQEISDAVAIAIMDHDSRSSDSGDHLQDNSAVLINPWRMRERGLL